MAVVLQGAAPTSLPEPGVLAPADALALGSELLDARAFRQALPYLIYAQRTRPTIFGWCRVAKVSRELGRHRQAELFYDQALAMEPDNRYALVGRAAALAECDDASLEELVSAAAPLPALVRTGKPGPVVYAAANLLRAANLLAPHPALAAAAAELRHLARELDDRAPEERRAEVQERLLSALRFADGELPMPGDQRPQALGSGPERRALPPPPPPNEPQR